MVSTNKQCFTLGGSVLMLSPRFSALAELFDIVDQTVDQVRSNLTWALVYNITAISLALGIGHPWGISISP
jgi:cation transport ATPase